MSPELVLSAMLALPQYSGDRGDSPEARRELYRPVAVAIAKVARTPEEGAFLITDAFAESGMARYVLEDRCGDGPRGARCDPDRHGVPRAHGAFQVWRRYCHATDIVGEARCVMSQARLGVARCSSWEGGFSALHTTASCNWSGAAPRVNRMRAVLARWGKR